MSKERLIIGLMSGTSHDGIDAALVKINGAGLKSRPTFLYYSRMSFTPALRELIRSAPSGSVQELCSLNFELGEAFARAAIACAKKAGKPLSSIDAIASHGQTICHLPPMKAAGTGSTLQIGESAVIAQRTGVPVVSDFRPADMAAGGHGAPLVPYADYILFKSKKPRVVQNIGGVANVTVVTPKLEDVMAFDTGPGNCMIDEAARSIYSVPFDKGGRIASGGTPDEKLLKDLLGFPYFKAPPPKSTGTDVFRLNALKGRVKRKNIRPEDLLCTLTHLTVESIKQAYDRFVFPRHDITEVIVAGGGTNNAFMMDLLAKGLFPVPVRGIEEFGIPAQAKEAVSFAILANETLSGNPSNVPSATGASTSVLLGKITWPEGRARKLL